MKIISQDFEGYFESKGSKFYCFVMEISRLDSVLAQLKATHPKAVHFVSATRYLNEFSQIVESSDDDNEPKGSSAPPLLNILRGMDLINIAVIVVRYFGGTLLGVGGLVRAYGSALKDALKNGVSYIKEYQKIESKILNIPYNQLSIIEYKAKILNINLEKIDFQIKHISIKLEGIDENLNLLLDQIAQI